MRRFCFAVALLLLAGCERPARVERVEWPVMGTVAALQWHVGVEAAPAEAVTRVRQAFAKVERLLNAHDAKSELRRLASCSDEAILAQCDPLVRPCYEAAFRLRDETQGLFNPRWRGAGTMDLGAIAKGFAVDLAAEEHALVDLGGNLKAGNETWRVGVAQTGERFDLAPGAACATSGEYFRGKHIRDGRTGGVLSNRVHSVTVIHPTSAMMADGLSTVLFLLGREAGERFLKKHYPEARAIWYTTQP